MKREVGYYTWECLSGVVQAFQVDWLLMILGRVEKGNDRGFGSAIEHQLSCKCRGGCGDDGYQLWSV